MRSNLTFFCHLRLFAGKIHDQRLRKRRLNGEALIGATVFIKEIRSGATTNEYGFYSITLPPATYSVNISYIGFQPIANSIELNKNVQLSVELQAETEQLQEVVVQGEIEQANCFRIPR